MVEARTTKVTNPQNSYMEVLPRLPHTLPMMLPSISLWTMMIDTHNQSPPHLTLPCYKSGRTSVPSSMTSSLNLINSVPNTTTGPMIKQMMPAPSLPAVSMTTTTKQQRTVIPHCFFMLSGSSKKSIPNVFSSSKNSKTLPHACSHDTKPAIHSSQHYAQNPSLCNFSNAHTMG